MSLESLIRDFLSHPSDQLDQTVLTKAKRKYAKEMKLAEMPTNMQLLKVYQQMVREKQIEPSPSIIKLLRKRSVRSESGIVPIQVLTKPFRCPGKCIFCPNDVTMPKSYINTQPGAMRALLNNFDPYKQAYNRLLSLTLTGHDTDKIEMIVLGGTRDVYPKKYKTGFIKGLYDACNHFDEFFAQIDIDMESWKAARYTETQDFCITYPWSIEESLKKNETAHHRIIWLTIETRPEYVTDDNCQYWREMGVTRIEMGIQSLFDEVLDANKRWHSVEQIRVAMHRLRQYAFKVSCHFMPWLYGSTVEKDIATFEIAYTDPWLKPDEQKFYPTAVIPNTELYDLRKSWIYHALSDEELKYITTRVQIDIIPPYTRIKRLARDFDTNEVVAGANTPNLRQLVEIEMDEEYKNSEWLRIAQYGKLYEGRVDCEDVESFLKKLQTTNYRLQEPEVWSLKSEIWNLITYIIWFQPDISSPREFVCLDTRSREIRHLELQTTNNKLQQDWSLESAVWGLIVRQYQSSVWTEYFIAYEDALGYLYGFMRLLLPDQGKSVDWEWLGEGTALIRELHVYGQVVTINNEKWIINNEDQSQHMWIWRQLMALAEQIACQWWYERVSVISGVGVRGYYEKLGYELVGTYMLKKIHNEIYL